MTKLYSCLAFLFFFVGAFAQNGHKIDIEIDNLESDTIIVAAYYGKANKVIDTLIARDGRCTLEGKDELAHGVYLVITKPSNMYFELILGDDQIFKVKTDARTPALSMKIKGSRDNEAFYDYIKYLDSKRKERDKITARQEAKPDDPKVQEETNAALEALNDEVKAYQKEYTEAAPNALNTVILQAGRQVDMPKELSGPDADKLQAYLYYKKHYFDYIDLSDNRLLYTNFIHKRIDYYMDKLTPVHPDSIIVSLDNIYEQMDKEGELFKYYLSYYLNEFAKSNIVGMDAVYVHLVDNYYAKGLAPWVEAENIEKIIENADRLRPILIGKVAPNFQAITMDEQPFELHKVQSPYTVLIFWAPDCGHCKTAIPKVKDFYNEWKDKGVKIVAVCTATHHKMEGCKEGIEDKGIEDWINVMDPYYQRFRSKYDVRTTPRIFVLDAGKIIKSKNIGSDQLGEVMNALLEIEANKNKK